MQRIKDIFADSQQVRNLRFENSTDYIQLIMKNKLIIRTAIFMILSALISCQSQKELLYVGTYSQRGSEGIYVYNYDRTKEEFNLLQTTPEIQDPNFFCIDPDGKFLYALTSRGDSRETRYDMLSTFAIDPNNGRLKFLDEKPSYGKGSCHISIDKTGHWLFVSHYSSGSLSVFPIGRSGVPGDTTQTIQYEGGSITSRQTGPHVHSIQVSPDNKFLYVADLGTDKIMIYSFDHVSGELNPAAKPFASSNPGAGPRHFAFHLQKPFFYLAEELSSTVTVFERDLQSGGLAPIQTISALPDTFSGDNTLADIHIDPSGKHLYASNRGVNSIAVFSIAENGKLNVIAQEPVQGDHPRNFMIDPNGEFLIVANMNSDNIVSFSIDKSTGLLKPTGNQLQVPAPVCVKWIQLP